MSIKEFRIGNRTNNGVIISIGTNHITCAGHYNISGMASFEEDKIKPDIITEDELLNFGFEKESHKNGNSFRIQINYSSGFKDFLLITNKGSINEPMLFTSLESNYKNRWIIAKPPKYVHQLQNLIFELKKEELTEEKQMTAEQGGHGL